MIEDNNFFLLIIYSLAIWRMSNFLVNEDGPYYIFIRIRVLFGAFYWNEHKHKIATADDIANTPEHLTLKYKTEASKAMSCVWCISVWVSAFFIICEYHLPIQSLEIFRIFALWLAMSALAIKINEV